ncbi:hypothetical protein OS122_02675 [Mycolicibacterium mucogenicum]|uniref:hypothetical protein n=1 Tax=Mycolicibacterium mucogenicum TaxID=56689 RepID=UPI002269A037|nr:hypothetical protein [Mycolicibacterium mucogenicum]MCX8559803.1 hypothetical protein [Mycolicibacterium mucogenicum]
MTAPDGLFDLPAEYVPPPPPEQLSRGERRKRLVESRIARGEHPLGRFRLHPDAPVARGAGVGLRCATCRFRVLLEHHNRTYPKCHFPVRIGERDTYPRDTNCESSDIRAWWPACTDYQPREDHQ